MDGISRPPGNGAEGDASRTGSRPPRPIAVLGFALLFVVVLAIAIAAIPLRVGDLTARPDPAADFATAKARYESAVAVEAEGVFEPCRSRLYEDGARTERAVVLVHGLTNCPRQFVELADAIHASGSNVLVLRIPDHGLATADGTAIGSVDSLRAIRASDYRDYADTAIDIAHGLGDRIDVLGLSLGGVVAAWVAQNRDVDRVVAVSPAIGLPGGMPWIVDVAFRDFFGRVPSLSIRRGGSQLDHAYVGESTRAIAQMYVLAEAVRRQARQVPPRARSIVVVTNGADTQVDNDDIQAFAEGWRRSAANVSLHQFPAELELPHDVIDVQQPAGRTDVVYPVLLDLLDGRDPEAIP